MPARRFFQIHLSTAVVLMFVAGVLVWANARPQFAPATRFGSEFRYGWPLYLAYDGHIILISEPPFGKRNPVWAPQNIAINTTFALAILVTVWQVCEWRIRRRAARKANEGSENR